VKILCSMDKKTTALLYILVPIDAVHEFESHLSAYEGRLCRRIRDVPVTVSTLRRCSDVSKLRVR
jgi:hypothetical protein